MTAKKKQPLKPGEKILLIVFGVFFVLAMIAYAALETVRLTREAPMFEQTTFFDFSEVGKEGSKLYREARCNSCHRALRTGTSMGLILDGIGSRRSVEWLEAFLTNPEATYGAPTFDHGLPPKEAAYVAAMPREDLRKIAVFLSELKADPGSAVAKVPPPERSEFIDNMVKMWAPESWKEKYENVRTKGLPETADDAAEGDNP